MEVQRRLQSQLVVLQDLEAHSRIDNVREDLDIQVIHGNDIRRGRSTLGAGPSNDDRLQLRITCRADNADGQSTTDEEDTETGVDGLERELDVGARALGLGSDHGNVLGADDGEAGRPQRAEETFEATEITSARVEVRQERAGVVPVPEAVDVALRVASNHGDEGEKEQGEDQNDLSTRKPELRLAISLDGQDVDETVKVSTIQSNQARTKQDYEVLGSTKGALETTTFEDAALGSGTNEIPTSA